MKIQFIIVGWHFAKFPETVQALYQLQEQVKEVDIFWIMHKTPPDFIKSNFEYKVFDNVGLERGAYQRAIDYLNPSDDTVLFLMHDDLAIKSFEFVNRCIELLNNGSKFIGNGVNYPAQLNPTEIVWKSKSFKELVKPDYQYLFDKTRVVKTIRGSFMCTLTKYLKEVGGYELIDDNPDDFNHIGGFGNLQQSLFGYKIHTYYGPQSISYLSDTYQDSEYIYEYARGKE